MASTEYHYHHHSQQIDEGALIAGRYRLVRWLGLGAVGEVWAARDERLGRDVAVKLVLGDASTDPRTADRYAREAIAAALINHPNVVAVHDQGEHHRYRFVVMELVAGCNLDELRGGRPMPVAAALAVAVQLTRALEAAHEAGVPHRDLKPTNVMVDRGGVVKVLDFGISGFLHGAGFAERLTRTGADHLGSPAYTAPERIMDDADDARSDLYSLGCMLYLLLTGMPPFPAADSLTVLHRQLHDEPVPVRRYRPQVATQLDQLVLWLLAKDPALRPASASVVAGRLESLALTYLNEETEIESTLADLLGVTAAQPVTSLAEQEPGPAPIAAHEEPRSFPRNARRRYAASLVLVLGVIAGLALGVFVSREADVGTASVIGTMPSADGSKATGATAMNASGVTPNAPITPYLRYTSLAPGSGGCVTVSPGRFECLVGRTGGAPVLRAGTLSQTGSLDTGRQAFYCQSSGPEYVDHGLRSRWWAWTQSAQGTWGWVSAVDLSGGANDQPEPGLPYCGG